MQSTGDTRNRQFRTRLGGIARDWLPPAFHRAIASLSGSSSSFCGEFGSWADASANCAGYDADLILNAVLESALKVKSGAAAFERDSVVFDEPAYEWPLLTGLLWAAARNSGALSVLDFGGSLGSSYFQHRHLLKGLCRLRWAVVEQPHYVRAGRKYLQDDWLRFHESIDDCVIEERPNAVLLSAVLAYIESPYNLLAHIGSLGAEVIIVDRTIVNFGSTDRLYIQRAPKSIYAASYPCWSLSESRLLESIAPGYELEQSFASLAFPGLHRIDSCFRGYIFRKNAPCVKC